MKIILLCAAFLTSTIVNAQQSIETDRPDQTETPALTPKEYFQGEFGFNYVNTTGRDYSLAVPTSLLKYGLGNRVELRLNIDYLNNYYHLIPDPVTVIGFEPVEIGTKIHLFNEKKALPNTSFIAHIGISDLSSKAFIPKKPVASVVLTMQHTMSDITSLGYNLGLKWEGYSSSPVFAYTFSPGFNITEKLSAFIEFFGFTGREHYHDHNIDAGIACLLNKNMKIDFAAGKGLSEISNDHFFSLGFSFRFPLMKQRK
jgi:hypothetical protein